MQKVLNIIRSQEWWETKLSPLLAIGYATALSSGMSLIELAPWLVFLLVAIIVGAIYVSVINDITDLEEDLASGKRNRIAGIRPPLRWLIPAGCIMIGLFFVFLLYPDWLSMLLYVLPWISFSLYSFNPVRLKRRGVWGLFADACGSHLFISLLFVSSVSYITRQQIDWVWFVSIGVWAFFYGLRGILWHQFYDRDNDLKINLKTYATKVNPNSFRRNERMLLIVEMLALVVIFYRIGEFLPMLFFVVYLLLVLIRCRRLGYKPIVVVTRDDDKFEFLMLDYYQAFLPLSLLITGALVYPETWILCAIHLLLFPGSIKKAIRDVGAFSKHLIAPYYLRIKTARAKTNKKF